MNKELIQKFLNKACYDGQDQYDLEDWLNVEKFSELIVEECIQVLKDTGYPNAHGNCVGVEELKQHLGIK